MTKYDKESVYDEQIYPLMKQIITIAKEHGIPMFATFQLNNEGDDPQGSGEHMMCTTLLANQPYAAEKFKELHGALLRRPSFAAITVTSKP